MIKISNKIPIFIFLNVAWVLISCSKVESKDNNILTEKLSNIVIENASVHDTITYLYDENSRIALIFLAWPDTVSNYYFFSRNASGQITSFTFKPADSSGYRVIYSIGKDGKYISAQTTIYGGQVIANEKYVYVGDRLTQIDCYRNDIYTEKKVFTFDNKGNIIKREYYYYTGGFLDKTEEMTYDNKEHPIDILDAPFALSNSFYFSSINNVLTQKTTDKYGSTMGAYTYSYDVKGKPLSANFNYQSSSGTDEESRIKYIYF